MAIYNCRNKLDCLAWALIASIVIGVLVAFLRITAVVEITSAALVVSFEIAVAYLAITLAVSSGVQRAELANCLCQSVAASIAGALGTVLTALILLAIPFVATSILGAIVTGALAASFTLLLTATACIIRCLTGSTT